MTNKEKKEKIKDQKDRKKDITPRERLIRAITHNREALHLLEYLWKHI